MRTATLYMRIFRTKYCSLSPLLQDSNSLLAHLRTLSSISRPLPWNLSSPWLSLLSISRTQEFSDSSCRVFVQPAHLRYNFLNLLRLTSLILPGPKFIPMSRCTANTRRLYSISQMGLSANFALPSFLSHSLLNFGRSNPGLTSSTGPRIWRGLSR